MAKHFAPRGSHRLLALAGVVVVLAAGGSALAVRAVGARGDPAAESASVPSSTAPPPPLSVTPLTPAAGAKDVNGTQQVVISTSAPVDTSAVAPTISPAVAGTWTATSDQLVFTPADAYAPSTTYTVTLPAGLRSTAGNVLAGAATFTFTTEAGSTLRLQQLLAELGYLPLHWTPSPAAATAPLGQSVFNPPAGTFSWAWPNPPPTLASQWAPGAYTVMVKGAVMAFESDHGLATDGIAGPEVWAALTAAMSSPNPPSNPHGYTYALANKALPESLTVWHDGTVISTSPANTGIAAAPTADGTFPVYERLATQVMRGTNPDGSHYADPVAWVAYFNGGDAIHYIARSAYGYPQSLGCVEVSYGVGKLIWPYLTIGSLVTVEG